MSRDKYGRPRKYRDLTGKRFGWLIVERRDVKKGPQPGAYWICTCRCGYRRSVAARNLIRKDTKSCGCMNGCFRIGKTYGPWKILSQQSGVGRNRKWACICLCGKEAQLTNAEIRSAVAVGCNCVQKAELARKVIEEQSQSKFRRFFAIYKASAKKRGIPWKLSFPDFCMISKRTCCYCGAQPAASYSGIPGLVSNGIDRMNSGDGYIFYNCTSACKKCNIGKGSLSPDQFVEWAYGVLRHQRAKSHKTS